MKRFAVFIMALLMCASSLPSFTARAAESTERYDPDLAISKAESILNGISETGSHCATYVSKVLQAGGLSISSSSAGGLMTALQNSSLGKIVVNPKYSDLDKGDVLCVTCSKNHGGGIWGLHTLIISSVGKDYVKCYAATTHKYNGTVHLDTYIGPSAFNTKCSKCDSTENLQLIAFCFDDSVKVNSKAAVVKVSSVALSIDLQCGYAGDTFDMSERLAVQPSNATNKAVNWSSSNANVAAVNSSGVVTFKSAGSAVITAAAADGSGKSASCDVYTILASGSEPLVSMQTSCVYKGDTVSFSYSAPGSVSAAFSITQYLFTDPDYGPLYASYKSQSFSGSGSVEYTFSEIGEYQCYVDAKYSGYSKQSKCLDFKVISRPDVYQMEVSDSAPEIGDTVTWTCYNPANGGYGDLYYEYRVVKYVGDEEVDVTLCCSQDYRCSYTPTEVGSYACLVRAVDENNRASDWAYGAEITVTDPAPVVSSFAASVGAAANAESASVGETVTWTAVAQGSGDLQYRFMLCNENTVLEQTDWSDDPTYSTQLINGEYTVMAEIKDADGNIRRVECESSLTVTGEALSLKATDAGDVRVTVAYHPEGSAALLVCYDADGRMTSCMSVDAGELTVSPPPEGGSLRLFLLNGASLSAYCQEVRFFG